jgi:thiol-disulfide isomerase/thioredoxin
VGQKAPDFVLEGLSGGSVSLEELSGKVAFVHFWATWCPPCLVELPGLMRFVQGLEKDQFTLLAVCVDNEKPERIQEFMRGWGDHIPAYLDPGGVLARKFGTFRFPETYILDPEGVLCGKVIGVGDWKMSKWAHILHACAGKKGSGKTESDTGP